MENFLSLQGIIKYFSSDLAIGAPNIDKVFVYKSYPTVRVTFNVTANGIFPTANSFEINACLLMNSTKQNIFASKKFL